MSFRPMVLVGREWAGNGVRFATREELFDKWLSLLGDEFEPGVMDQINGQPTAGMHGVPFAAREV